MREINIGYISFRLKFRQMQMCIVYTVHTQLFNLIQTHLTKFCKSLFKNCTSFTLKATEHLDLFNFNHA